MSGLVTLTLILLILGLIAVALIAFNPTIGTQARQAHRLFTILRNDAAVRLQDEQEHQATLGALRETRRRVAAREFDSATFDPYDRPPPNRRSGLAPLVVVGVILGLGGAALLLMIQSSPIPSVTQPANQAVMPGAPDVDTPLPPAPQPTVVSLPIVDFTAACRHPSQYGDPTAIAKIVSNSSEPPSYWVKCFRGDQMLGGLDLDRYCGTIEPGTYSDNPKRYDYTVTDQPWLSWECVAA